jgi:hypothetical protein
VKVLTKKQWKKSFNDIIKIVYVSPN